MTDKQYKFIITLIILYGIIRIATITLEYINKQPL